MIETTGQLIAELQKHPADTPFRLYDSECQEIVGAGRLELTIAWAWPGGGLWLTKPPGHKSSDQPVATLTIKRIDE
jgi:hypothetical protein